MTSPARLLVLLVLSLGVACGGGSGDTDTEGGSSSTTDDPTGGQLGDCGNDMIEEGEECDGAELAGKTCSDLDPAYTGGTLACGATCTFDASGCMVAPDQALVRLNEVTSQSVMSGPAAGAPDAIELFNAGGKAADLSGWMLSDDPTFMAAKTYVFPDGTTLAPGAFKVLVSQDPMTMAGDYPFGVSKNTAETITLADAQGGMIDSVLIDGYKARVSYCRLPDGTGAWDQCEQTFGAANMLAATACGNGKLEAPEECDGAALGGKDCKGLGLGYSGGTLACNPKCNFDTAGCTTTSTLVINELESTADDIEIYNDGAAAVDLSGWILTDDFTFVGYDPVMDGNKMIFAPLTSIGAKEYLVVKKGMGQNEHPFGLSADGDTVTLLDPNGQVVDLVTYAMDQAVTSLCRLPDGPDGTWTAVCTPSLGAPNQP